MSHTLKNLGYEATPIDGVSGYESPMITLCAHCAEGSSVDGKPFLSLKGEDEPFPVYSNMGWPEVDSPIHCEDCGALIPCALTIDGRAYVKEYCRTRRSKGAKLYREFSDYLFQG